MEVYDYLVVGGGIFGVYAATYLRRKRQRVLLIEKEHELLKKASVVNQTRLHGGYHYPRSIATARIADHYKSRFTREHAQFINFRFEQYYGIERYGSFTNSDQFERFCRLLHLAADKVRSHPLFNCDRLAGLFLTKEFSFDPVMLAEFYRAKLRDSGVTVQPDCTVTAAVRERASWVVSLAGQVPRSSRVRAFNVINATYSATNTVNRLFRVRQLELAHEVTELALVSAPALAHIGLTVMDGQFCSIMPYGLSNLLALSSVVYTHHSVSRTAEPRFACQNLNPTCKPDALSICTTCTAQPRSNQYKMIAQLKRYLHASVQLQHVLSLYAIKSKLRASYLDDGRPTEISKLSANPNFYCVFAGKVNSIYEIEQKVGL